MRQAHFQNEIDDGSLGKKKRKKSEGESRGDWAGGSRKTSGDSKGRQREGGTWADNGYVQ